VPQPENVLKLQGDVLKQGSSSRPPNPYFIPLTPCPQYPPPTPLHVLNSQDDVLEQGSPSLPLPLSLRPASTLPPHPRRPQCARRCPRARFPRFRLPTPSPHPPPHPTPCTLYLSKSQGVLLEAGSVSLHPQPLSQVSSPYTLPQTPQAMAPTTYLLHPAPTNLCTPYVLHIRCWSIAPNTGGGLHTHTQTHTHQAIVTLVHVHICNFHRHTHTHAQFTTYCM
jgi:hypothetical protein